MREIMTVLGPICPEELGFCQCHEHILISRGRSFEINPALCIDDTQKSLKELLCYKAAGGNSILDAQPGGCNRMPQELADISAGSGVHIIAATGFHKLIFYSEAHWIHTASAKMLTDFFIYELETGMYTKIDDVFLEYRCQRRAGFIKTALDAEGLTPRYQRLFSAAADAALATDKNIMIHVEQQTNPVKLLEYLLSLHVNPVRLIFCHMDRACPEIETHLNILKHGCFLEFDTIGRFKYHSDLQEIKLMKALIDAGYENQLLYALDTTRLRLKAYDANAIGLDYILTTFNPLLKEGGITAKQLHLIAVENCMKALT